MLTALTLIACAAGPSPDTAAGSPTLSSPEHPVVIGALSARDVEAVLRGQRREALRCYEDALTDAPGLAGTVQIKLTVRPDGSVSRAATRSSSLNHPPTEDCLIALASGAHFPAPGAGSAYISYAYVFSPGG